MRLRASGAAIIRLCSAKSRIARCLRCILDVEASHLALAKTEHVSDRLVLEPVRLALERPALEVADRLPDLCDDRAIRGAMKAYRLDVRTDHAPLPCPVGA